MSIESPVGTLDIKNATLRVGKLEVSNIQGIDTALNVTRSNSILLYDDQASATTFNGFTSTSGVRNTASGYLDVAGGHVYWGQKLPNAWTMEFEMDIRSGTNSGPIYANVFSSTNTGGDGYSFTFNDSNDKITLMYDGAVLTETSVPGLFTTSENWQKVVINYERGMITVSLSGSRAFYYNDIEREKPYTTGEYVNVSSSSTDGRKIRGFKVTNGDKWTYSGESNITYTHGSLGIGVVDPTATLDVAGTVNATAFVGDGTLLSNVVNDTDLQSNVTTLRDEMASNTVTLRGDLQSNVTTLRDEMASNTTTLRGDLQSNVTTLREDLQSNVTILREDLQSNVTTLRGEMTSNTTTLRGDLQSNVTTLREDLQSNVTTLRDEMASNTTTLRGDLQSNVTTLRGEMASNTVTLRGDLQSNVTTLRGEMASNTTTLRGDLQSNVTTLRGEMTSNTTTLRGDLQSNVTILRGEMTSNTTTLRGDLQSNVTTLRGEMTSNTTTLRGDLQSNVTILRGEMTSNTTTLRGDLQSNVTTLRGEMTSNTTTLRGDLQSNVTTLRGEMASNTVTLRGDLQSNVTTLRDTAITFQGKKTFQDDVILESNLRIQGDILVANTINMTVSDPILELGSNNQNTGDLGLVMTRHGSSNSNVAVFFDESADVLKLGYTLNGANDSTLDLDSNALAVNIQGDLTAASLSGDGSGLTSLNAGNIGSGTLHKDRLPTTLNNTTIGSLAVGTNDVTLTAKANYHGLKILKAFDSPDEPATLLLAGDGDVFDDIAFEIRGNTTGSTVDTSTTRNSNDTTFAVLHTGTTYIGYNNLNPGEVGGNSQSGDSILNVNGDISATTFTGSGSDLTSLNADNLGSGTVPSARLSLTASDIPSLDADKITTGTIDSGRLSLTASDIPSLDADKITTGTIDSGRLSLTASDIPSLDAAKITTGTIDSGRLSLVASDIPSLDAGKITTGTIDSDRLSLVASDIPSLDAGKITTGTIDSGRLSLTASDIPSLDAGKITTGTIDSGRLSLTASDIPSLDAGKITTGTIDSGRLSLVASDIPSLDASKITSGTLTRPINTTTGTFSGRVDSDRYLTSNTFSLPDPNQHSFRHVCMVTTPSAPYGLTQAGGCIYEYNPSTGDTVRVVDPVSEPTAGTFAATVGREYFPMGSPMTIVNTQKVVPFTNLGSLFGFIENRYDATTAYLYAPYSNVSVEYFHDTSVTGTPTSTIVVPCKTVVSFTCTSASGTNSHVFVAKGGRILMSSTGNGGDTRVLAPLSTIAYGYNSASLANDIYLENDVTTSGKCVYSNQNVPLILSQAGDGDGGDGTCGIPFELVADTYIVPHDIRGWEFQFLYTETIVNVSYWSATNSQWEQYGTYSPSGTPSILSPEELQVGKMSKTGSDIGTSHTLWMFAGTKDFTLTVEEYTELERTVSGFRAHQVAQQIQTNLLDNVVQDSSGNVGIGTDSPTSKLELFQPFVAQGLYDAATLKFSTTNDSVNWDVGSLRGAVALNNGGTSNYPGGLIFATKAPGASSDALVDRMVIDANGNVGIDTTSPGYKLDVDGTVNTGALTATSVSGSGSGLTDLNADNIGSGTVPSARLSLAASDIPSLDAGKITTGTIDSDRLSLVASDIPSLDAGKITTGTIDSDRLSLVASDIPSLDAGKITTGTFDAARISNGTVADSTGGVKAIYFENTEQSGYYTDKSGILAFDENFYDDTEYGTGTYDPDSTFVGGNGGGLLIKNQDGWGAIFTSQNTRWAKGYWDALDITNTVTATTFSGSGSGLTDLNADNIGSGTVPSARLSLAASDIPSLDAGKITTGTIDSGRLSLTASDIPSLDAGKITTGTIDSDRLSLVASDIPSLDAGKITSGTLGRPISTTTGVFTSTGNAVLVGPSGGGQVGLTINDGDGNTNITFNHASRIPDQNGSSGRIDCGVDGTSGYMRLRVKDNVTGGTSTGNLPDCVRIEEGYVRAYSDFYAGGNVGIGTTSPGYKLDVNGTVNTGALTATSGTFSGNVTVKGNQEIRHPTTDSRGYVELKFNNNGPNQGSGAGLVLASDEVSSFNPIAIIDTWKSGVSGNPPLVFKTRGTERMRLTDSGNLGIGTTSPNVPLHVNGSINMTREDYTGGPALGFINPDGSYSGWFGFGSSTTNQMRVVSNNNYPITFWTNATGIGEEKMRVDSSGNVGIGTTSPNDKLEIYGATDSTLRITTDTGQAQLLLRAGATTRRACRIDFSRADTGTQYMNIIGDYQQNATDDLTVSSSTSGRIMTWLQNGNVGIGTTSPSYKLHVSGDIYATGNVTAYSDVRKKKNLEIIERPIEKVNKLNGYTYEMDDKRYTGLVAQEVLKVLPEAVVGDEEKGYGLAYGNMAGLFVEAMKHMNEQLQAEKARNDALEARIAALENA
jgi:hypothetical protein